VKTLEAVLDSAPSGTAYSTWRGRVAEPQPPAALPLGASKQHGFNPTNCTADTAHACGPARGVRAEVTECGRERIVSESRRTGIISRTPDPHSLQWVSGRGAGVGCCTGCRCSAGSRRCGQRLSGLAAAARPPSQPGRLGKRPARAATGRDSRSRIPARKTPTGGVWRTGGGSRSGRRPRNAADHDSQRVPGTVGDRAFVRSLLDHGELCMSRHRPIASVRW